ncbi:unnamed protein product, partial [Rotaria sordida]
LQGYFSSVKQCFLGLLGDFHFEHYAKEQYLWAGTLLFILYVVIITILLLNLLIAMMGDTYKDVKRSARQLWHLERTRIVLDIESGISASKRQSSINKYWVDIQDNLVKLKDEQFNITYTEWIKKKYDKPNVPVSTKTTFTSSIVDFITKFINEINDLIPHIDRVHQQFRASKQARQAAMEQEDTITIHLDWSESFKLKQARQEKAITFLLASYYYEQHISILSGHLWKKNDCFSFGSISDDTNHMSEATWAAIQHL